MKGWNEGSMIACKWKIEEEERELESEGGLSVRSES